MPDNTLRTVILALVPSLCEGDAPAPRRDLIITVDSTGQLRVQVGGRIVINAEEERGWANSYHPRLVTTTTEAAAVNVLLGFALTQVPRRAQVPNQDAIDIFVFDLTPPASDTTARERYLDALTVLSAIDAPT